MPTMTAIPFTQKHLEAFVRLKENEAPGSGIRWRKRFSWQYLESPWALEAPQIGVCLVDEGGHVFACMLSMLHRFQVFGTEHLISVANDLIVDESLRTQGLGVRIVMEYFKVFGKSLAVVTSASDVTCRLWEVFRGRPIPGGDVHLSVILRPKKLVEAKLRAGLGPLATCLARPAAWLWMLLTRRAASSVGPGLTAVKVAADDERLGALWRRTRSQYSITTVRDAAYLQWRHGKGKSSMLLVSRQSGESICWVAYIRAPQEKTSDPKRARILDVFGAIDNVNDCKAAMQAALQSICDDGYDVADFKGLHTLWQNTLRGIGGRLVDFPNTFVYRSKLSATVDLGSSTEWI